MERPGRHTEDSAVMVKCFGVATSYLIIVGDLAPSAAETEPLRNVTFQVLILFESTESDLVLFEPHFVVVLESTEAWQPCAEALAFFGFRHFHRWEVILLGLLGTDCLHICQH